MHLQLEALQDEFTDLLELHDELVDEFDGDDPEVRALRQEIRSRMRIIGRSLQALEGSPDPDSAAIDELDQLVDEVNDAFGELALLR